MPASQPEKARSLAFSTLKARIILVCVLVLVVQSLFVLVILNYSSGQIFRERAPAISAYYTKLLQMSAQDYILMGSQEDLKDYLTQATAGRNITDAIVLDCSGLSYASSTQEEGNAELSGRFTDIPEGIYENMLLSNRVESGGGTLSDAVRYAVAPLPCPETGGAPKTVSSAALVVRYDYSAVIAQERDFYYLIGFGQLLISAAFMFSGAFLLQNFLSRKLSILAESMGEFSSANQSDRYAVQGAEEIDAIGLAFNRMADTIQRQLLKIRNANKRLVLTDKVFELSSVGVVILSKDLQILDANPAFVQINGYQLHEVVGKHFDFLSHDMPDNERHSILTEAQQGGSPKREFWMRSANGKRFRKSLKLSPVYDSEGDITHYFMVESDVTEEYMQKLQMQTLATTDSLTGLKNRRQFEIDSTNITMTEAGCCAIACIDLDGLKEINTKYGHLSGDQLIEVAGRRLMEQVENVALGVYRLGGDEFCVILNHPGNNEELTRICRAMMAAVEGSLKIDMITTDLTIGVGVSLYNPDRHQGIQDLIREADIALKEAKRLGRSSLLVATPEALSSHERRTNLSLALKSPELAEQIQVSYLPKVDIQNNILSGAEALVRWTSPDLGFIRNEEFIPIAEETGDILKIDEWVMRRAISDAALFCKLIDGFQTTINVSPRQLFESYYSEDLIHQLEINRVDAENFSVEITEWTAIQHHDKFVPVLNALRSAGIAVELDDFGTGHSSLVNLHRLPVDALKIDRDFVHSMVDNRVSMEIVRSIIMLSHSLKMTVVAEGVENVTQLEILRELGCDYCQGYLYSEPIIVEGEASLQAAIAQWQESIESIT